MKVSKIGFYLCCITVLLSSCMPSTQFSEGRTRQNPIEGSSNVAPVYGGATWYWEIFIPSSNWDVTRDDVKRVAKNYSEDDDSIIRIKADLREHITIDRLIGPTDWEVTIEKASFLRIALGKDSYIDGLDLIFAAKIPEDAKLGEQSLLMFLKYLDKGNKISGITFDVLEKETN